MVKDKNQILNGIIGNIQDISKALDVLSEHEVSAYIYLLISEKMFNPQISQAMGVEHPSDFLRGVHAALEAVGSLPEVIAALTKK